MLGNLLEKNLIILDAHHIPGTPFFGSQHLLHLARRQAIIVRALPHYAHRAL